LKPFDATGAFCAPANDLRRTAVRGAGVTVFSGGVGLAIQIVATVLLARILTPSDFGVVAMVTTFSLLFMNFGLNGFIECVLQWDAIDHYLISNLFWINLAVGLLLTVGFAAAGSLLARFYGDQRVTGVAIVMSATIFITSISVLHQALLKRAMYFSALSVNEVLARAIAVAVSITFALAGKRYWALVAGCIAQPLAVCLGVWFLCRWVPSLPRRAAGTGAMVRFAMHVYGRFSVNYFARNLDNLLVGWRFDAWALGFYKKAYDLFALSASQTVAPLTSVAVSALSRFKPASVEYRRYLLNSVAVMTFLGMGLGAVLTLTGKDLIRILLGPGWAPAGRIFTFFGPGIGIMLLYGTHGWIHLSIGRADRWFQWGILEFVVTALLFAIGLHWGPSGIALAWTISFWILTLPAFWYAGHPIGLRVGAIVKVVWRYVVASLAAACICQLILNGIPTLIAAAGPMGAAMRLLSVSFLFGLLYVAAVTILHRSTGPLRQVYGLFCDVFSRERPARHRTQVAGSIELSETLTGSGVAG
jgi:O-antigen/teichoic acid export membrane protein